MKKRGFGLLIFFIFLIYWVDAQTLNYQEDQGNIIKISNELNSGQSLTGLNIKQGATNYLDDSTYTYWDTKTGSSKDVQFTLENVSSSMLAIISSGVVGDGFTMIGSIPTFFYAGATAYFTIRFSPTAVQQYTGYLNITTNNPDDQFYHLNFVGKGATVGINTIKRENSCRIYPNPISESAMVKLNSDNQSDVSFVLINAIGQKVFNTLVPKGNSGFQLQRNNLPSGIYHYMFLDDQNALLTSGKIIMK